MMVPGKRVARNQALAVTDGCRGTVRALQSARCAAGGMSFEAPGLALKAGGYGGAMGNYPVRQSVQGRCITGRNRITITSTRIGFGWGE